MKQKGYVLFATRLQLDRHIHSAQCVSFNSFFSIFNFRLNIKYVTFCIIIACLNHKEKLILLLAIAIQAASNISLIFRIK